QGEIIFRLVRMLNVKLVAAEATRSEQRKAVDPDARDFVMRGLNLRNRSTSPTTLIEARQAFERALEIDSRSNDARIGLAKALTVSSVGSVSRDVPRAEQLALEAIEREPNSSEAHVALGFVRPHQKDRLREGQIEFETALALDRNNLNAVRQLGWASANLGELEACIAQAENSLWLRPRDAVVWVSYAQLGNCDLFLNHVDLATDYLTKARAATPQ